MKLLEQMIFEKGEVLNGNILKVDSFMNHQIDPELMERVKSLRNILKRKALRKY